MGRLSERLDVALRALGTLDELARKSSLTAVERDALLQRFEYSLEAVWKAAQRFLSEVEGIDVGSPNAAIRASLRVDLLDEQQARDALVMVQDRNLTVHTYDERLANDIAGRIPAHARVLRSWVDAMAARLSAA
ncbi:MAG: nucleotidyltransferase substrate binding protein [Candidatus Binatia bacterium]